MKKLFRLLFRVLLFACIIILGFVIINTLGYSSKQIKVDTINKTDIDDKVAERLGGAIQIPSVSTEIGIDSAAFGQLLSYIDSQFVLVDSLLDKQTINEFSRIYKWTGRKPNLKPILLLAHLDVVPVDKATEGKWEQDPFSGAIKDGYVWGRGTLDDKVSVLSILESIESLLQQNYFPERTLYLAFGHDEEIGGKAGAKSISRLFQQQGISFEYILDEGSLLIKQALPSIKKPIALIGIAEKGYVTLNIAVRLENGGHSSIPPTEGTAIGILSKAIATLEEEQFPAQLAGASKKMFEYTGPEMTLPSKAIFANIWLFEGMLLRQLEQNTTTNAMVRTTTAPTMIRGGIKENVLPSTVSGKINFRIAPGETPESVLDYVKQTINDDRVIVTINKETAMNPSKVSPTNAFGFEIIQKTAQELFPDIIVAPSLVVAATDCRHYGEVSDNIYRFMPLMLERSDLKRIHGINERVSVEGYKNMIRFYQQLIRNSCK